MADDAFRITIDGYLPVYSDRGLDIHRACGVALLATHAGFRRGFDRPETHIVKWSQNGSQGAEHLAKGARAHNCKHQNDRQHQPSHQGRYLKCRKAVGNHGGQAGLESAGRTDPAEGVQRIFTPQVRGQDDKQKQEKIFGICSPMRQRDLDGRDLMQEILQQTEGTNPAANQSSQKHPHQQHHSQRNKREEMVAGKMDKNTDGAGKPGQDAGVATEDGVAEPLQFRPPGTVKQQER